MQHVAKLYCKVPRKTSQHQAHNHFIIFYAISLYKMTDVSLMAINCRFLAVRNAQELYSKDHQHIALWKMWSISNNVPAIEEMEL